MGMSEFEDAIIGNARLNAEALIPFGFVKQGDSYLYERPIVGNAFTLKVLINETGELNTELTDNETLDTYNLYRLPNAHGEFVTSVRDAIKEVLQEIKARCYVLGAHNSDAFFFVRDHFESAYGEKLEYLWDDDENCILRRADNRKWYAVIMRVAFEKLGIQEEGMTSVIAFRGDPIEVDGKTLFPGYHLNKKYWVTMVLDGRSPKEELLRRLEASRELALKKGKK